MSLWPFCLPSFMMYLSTSISFRFLKAWDNHVTIKSIFPKLNCEIAFSFSAANNSGVNKRQITDLVDQSIQINAHCFVVTADNRYILICGFWDKSFRVYSTETGRPCITVICISICNALKQKHQ